MSHDVAAVVVLVLLVVGGLCLQAYAVRGIGMGARR